MKNSYHEQSDIGLSYIDSVLVLDLVVNVGCKSHDGLKGLVKEMTL